MKLHAWQASTLATQRLPGKSLVIQFADDEGLFPPVYDRENAVETIRLMRPDDDSGSFTQADAKRILDAVSRTEADHLVAQCMAGIGRSVAVCMALAKIHGGEYEWRPTYNRGIYKTLLQTAGVPLPREPLVSICVRVKYESHRLLAFLLSLKYQRYDNWEAVCFGDFTKPPECPLPQDDDRIKFVDTAVRCRRWGHPHRQFAFEQCRGEWIGTNNDDNYLTPGYIEQLVHVGETRKADVVMCSIVHRYSAWNVVPGGYDLSSWLARADLVHSVPWTGTGFHADAEYLKAMMDRPGVKCAEIQAPLVVKN